MNWLIHPIQTLRNWGVKAFVLNVVNTALAKYDGNVTTARWYVQLYVTKIEALLAFLKSLDSKLADGKLAEDEADSLVKEAKSLAADLVA